jgi:hypothetical protein
LIGCVVLQFAADGDDAAIAHGNVTAHRLAAAAVIDDSVPNEQLNVRRRRWRLRLLTRAARDETRRESNRSRCNQCNREGRGCAAHTRMNVHESRPRGETGIRREVC